MTGSYIDLAPFIPSTINEEWKYTDLRPVLQYRFTEEPAESKTIRVEKNTTAKNIISIQNIGHPDTARFPKISIKLEDNSEATVLEVFSGDARYFVNALTEIHVARGARLHYYREQNDSLDSFHIGTTRITQERDSEVESFSLALGAQISRHNLDFVLNGESTKTVLNGLVLLNGKQHADNHTSIDHRYPHCQSSQLYKGVLDGQSRSVFNGKIFVRQAAQKTNAYQLNKHILLSSKAHVDTKPQLEIQADDVKCTHGATIGQLSRDELFYLQTRAIDKTTAQKILCHGFVHDVVDRIQNAEIKERFSRMLEKND